jgi:hypothetical protein
MSKRTVKSSIKLYIKEEETPNSGFTIGMNVNGHDYSAQVTTPPIPDPNTVEPTVTTVIEQPAPGSPMTRLRHKKQLLWIIGIINAIFFITGIISWYRS